MSAMTIFLTGGTGFFGRSLLRFILDHPEVLSSITTLTIFTRSPDAFLARYPEFKGHPWLCFHRGDILEPQSFPHKGSFSHILHAAADSTNGLLLSPLERYRQIVHGTQNTLDFAVRMNVTRVLLTSSGGVYGPQPQEVDEISETYLGMPDPLDSANAYGVSKRAAEHLCMLYRHQYGLEVVVARCFAFVGSDLPRAVHFAIGNFIRDALAGEPIRVQGDGSQLRTYLDQRDLAHWLWTLLLKGFDGEAYNVGSDQVISIKELAYLVRAVLAPHSEVMIKGESLGGYRSRYVPCIKKAREALGLGVKFDLETAMLEIAKDKSRWSKA